MFITETQKINRTYKDSLFCSIFGKQENKKYLLELYNALNNSNYSNLDDLEFTTIENVIYVTIKNDVSFLIDSQLNLYEQQSTFNPNMPLRGLMYFAQLYQMHLSKIGKDLYGTTLVKIPTPKFVVFYNGKKEIDDITTLKLSDAFEKPDTSGNFEWTATVVNINKNHNSSLLKSCKALYDYSEFIDTVKKNVKSGQDKNTAINNAVQYAIKANFLGGYFNTKIHEVLGMSLTEFDQEEYDRNRLEEGRAEGRNEHALETAKNLININLPLEQIAQCVGLPLEEVLRLKEKN